MFGAEIFLMWCQLASNYRCCDITIISKHFLPDCPKKLLVLKWCCQTIKYLNESGDISSSFPQIQLYLRREDEAWFRVWKDITFIYKISSLADPFCRLATADDDESSWNISSIWSVQKKNWGIFPFWTMLKPAKKL